MVNMKGLEMQVNVKLRTQENIRPAWCDGDKYRPGPQEPGFKFWKLDSNSDPVTS